MAATYAEAVVELFKGPHATFVAERKRLAGELKTAGDKAGAATFAKLGRPPISAWAVNQLWWLARAEFEVFLDTARRMREGDMGATPPHREAGTALRARAAKILTEAGNAANENTLRRVATTLSAIAAHGGFAPDPDGALTDDRDPPGFEAAGIPATVVAPAPPALAVVAEQPDQSEEERQAAAEEARKRLEFEAAERQKKELALKAARAEVERIRSEISALQRQVMEAEGRLVQARALVDELEDG